MDSLKYENFKNICRMCLSNCDINFNKKSVMLDIYHKLTDVHFETNNELPQQICVKCYDFMNEIHSFSVTCKQTHSVLMKCLNDYKIKRTKVKQEIVEETNEQINMIDEITIDEHKIELVNDDGKIKQETEIKKEITIEEHEIEFINVGLDYNPKTIDVLNRDVTERTNDLLTPRLIKIHTENEEDHISEHRSVSKIINNVQIRHYKCDQCEKSFRYSSSLIRHKRVHSGEKPYKCDHCDKSYAQSGDLIKHIRVHSGEKPFKCDQCGKSFAESRTLKNHERLHSGARPYKCDQCEKSFSQVGHLKVHKVVHTGARPYKCDICDKSFTRFGRLQAHIRLHSGERPYKCDECKKTFTESGALIRHKRLHSSERPYKCDQCGKSFIQSSILKVHERVHSGERLFK